MMEVVVTTGLLELLGRAKVQSNHHHQQTNIQLSQFCLLHHYKVVCVHRSGRSMMYIVMCKMYVYYNVCIFRFFIFLLLVY